MDTVIVAFENAKFVRQLRELLESAGVAECLPCSSGDQVRRLLQRQGACCVICGPHLTDGPSEWLFDDLPPSCLMLMVGPKHQLDLCGSPDIFKLPTPLRREETILTVRLLIQFSHRMERFARSSRSSAEQRDIDRAKRALMEKKGLTEEEATGSRSGVWTRAGVWSRPPGRCWRSWRSRRPKDRASSGPELGPELVLFLVCFSWLRKRGWG